jgi:mRNA-degrading endonuclease RelE of RelBE toxin-antitoxin system
MTERRLRRAGRPTSEVSRSASPSCARSLTLPELCVGRKLPRNERERILAAIERLPAGDVRSLKGRPSEWRLRGGGWRALIRLDSAARVIVVTAVKRRGGAYDR